MYIALFQTMIFLLIVFGSNLIVSVVSDKFTKESVAPFTENEMYFIDKEGRKPCTYFMGKKPSGIDTRKAKAESGLVNCTWYREEACCRRTEVTSVFSKMYPLNLASERCKNLINYMMCYWCSPMQYKWYYKRLFICKDFCDEMYTHCATATWNDEPIASKYTNGIQFCEAQKFKVVITQPCFEFDPSVLGFSVKLTATTWLHLLFLFIFQIFTSS